MYLKKHTNPIIAVIVPCYNEETVLEISNKVFSSILTDMIGKGIISNDSYICYVNDGSEDKSWEIISKFMKEDSHIRGLSFSRNYGHQSAMLAGFRECKADAYITIDADLQEEPEVITQMVEKYCDGYDVVYGVRASREKDSFFKRTASILFYKAMEFLGSETMPNSSEVRLISDRVAYYIRNYPEKNVYLRGIITSIGFPFTTVDYTRGERCAGETKYPFSKLLAAALDGVTTTSVKLLSFIFILGGFLFIAGIICLLISLINIIYGFSYSWQFFLIFLILSVGGFQLFALSVVGEYIGKIFKEVKNRPSYIIDEDYRNGI